jgi:hypothetical protein
MITTGGSFMRTFPLLSALALLILAACAPSAQAIQTAIARTQAAGGMSAEFTLQLNKLLEDGATLTAMTIQGTTLPEYRMQLAQTKGDYSLALTAQTGNGIPAEVVDELNQAFTAWELARFAWDARLNGGQAPRAPDVGGYRELVEYVGLEGLPFVGGIPGEGPVDQDRVLPVLFSLGADHFGQAQYLLIAEMKKSP